MNDLKNKKHKILYLVNQFSMHGGIQRMLSLKIDAWIDEFGYEVIVIALNQDGKEIVYPTRHEFKFIDLGLKKVSKQSLVDLYKFSKRINNIIQQEKPSLVITTITGLPSLLLPLLSSRVKKVLEIHSSGELSVTKNWTYKWYFLNKYHRVVLLNEDEKQYYKLENLTVIPNFIKVVRDTLDIDIREKLIISAGRIHPDKQYDHLMQIWNQVYKKYPDWRLEIYGNGDPKLLQKFQNYFLDYNIERIQFYPAVENLDKKLKEASIFALTSDTESFSMVLLECKNAGLPAISYDCPNGPRHIITDDGVLIEHNNMEQFSKQLEKLLLDEDLRKKLGNNAFKNRDRFSSKEIIKRWNDLI